jgi:hypothetical protein
MSCCGNARSENAVRPINGTYQPYPLTTQQPSPHPVITPFQEKPFQHQQQQQPFQPPGITSPPPAHVLPHMNGGAQSPPPPSTMTHSSLPPSSPPPTQPQMSGFIDPMGSLSPLRRPSPAYPAAGNPNIISTYQSSAPLVPNTVPPTDEGKMSVSIDFGERRVSLSNARHVN